MLIIPTVELAARIVALDRKHKHFLRDATLSASDSELLIDIADLAGIKCPWRERNRRIFIALGRSRRWEKVRQSNDRKGFIYFLRALKGEQ